MEWSLSLWFNHRQHQSETLSNVAARLSAKPMSIALATVFAASFDIRHSSFTSHSAHSGNIISGTPEREWSEWDERSRSRGTAREAVEPSGSERDTMLLALAFNCLMKQLTN
jgi:hypothetical protein